MAAHIFTLPNRCCKYVLPSGELNYNISFCWSFQHSSRFNLIRNITRLWILCYVNVLFNNSKFIIWFAFVQIAMRLKYCKQCKNTHKDMGRKFIKEPPTLTGHVNICFYNLFCPWICGCSCINISTTWLFAQKQNI